MADPSENPQLTPNFTGEQVNAAGSVPQNAGSDAAIPAGSFNGQGMSLPTTESTLANQGADGLPTEGGASEERGGNGEGNSSSQKPKRRSKNDNEGRNYACGCGKMYLSYPALYTHIKTKHGGKNPEGTNAPQFQNGRGRGRPKKTEPNHANKTSEIKRALINAPNPTESNFLREMGVYGGPCPPLEGFPVVLESQTQRHTHHPLYFKIQEILKKDKDMNGNPGDNKCDDIFASYLYEHSQIVVPKFYRMIVSFVCNFRECLNQMGWSILRSHEKITEIPSNKEFSVEHNAEHAPEICNEFITEFLPQYCPSFEKNLAIQLTRHFCNWLYVNGYTHSKLSLI